LGGVGDLVVYGGFETEVGDGEVAGGGVDFGERGGGFGIGRISAEGVFEEVFQTVEIRIGFGVLLLCGVGR